MLVLVAFSRGLSAAALLVMFAAVRLLVLAAIGCLVLAAGQVMALMPHALMVHLPMLGMVLMGIRCGLGSGDCGKSRSQDDIQHVDFS
jgi:hypothetical protein